MAPVELRRAREARGRTQQQVADTLGVSQAYWALLESGKRELTTRLAERVVILLNLSPTRLPVERDALSAARSPSLAGQLGSLGYPGFAYMRHRRKRNPAAVLVSALLSNDLEPRIVEALPWLVLQYPDLDWEWVLTEVKLRDLQNRLGFVVSLAHELAAARKNAEETGAVLSRVTARLERARLAREDTLCQENLSAAERAWLRKTRPAAAAHWNLLSDLRPEALPYAA
ncbi:MAG: helix-turn-helix transcriptional regulator [Bryobacterales bacterium]|nr:helix-turn-helix transcriptional regulator [Bryobacterales bacterium]